MHHHPIQRHRTLSVRVGDVVMGGEAPVVVQSMTNTDTADVEATVRQVEELARFGSELVRITVNTDQAAASFWLAQSTAWAARNIDFSRATKKSWYGSGSSTGRIWY